jgi:integrase
MARKSFQKGCLQWHNNQWTLLYWLVDHKAGKRVQKRECAAFKSFTDRNDKKAAQETAIEFLKPINRLNSNPIIQAEKSLTFAQFVKGRWASYLANRKLEPSTLDLYACITRRHLLPFFGDDVLAEISMGRVTDFFDRLAGKRKAGTIANIYKVLHIMFDVAFEYGFISVKPIRKKLHKPECERAEKPILPVEQARELLRGLTYNHRLFVATLAVLTVRFNEGAALRWQNVDFETGLVSLTHGLYKGKLKAKLKTKASRRKFELPTGLLAALKKLRSESQFNSDDDFIFCDAIGQPINALNFLSNVLYPQMDRLGIQRATRTHGFHILRHTAATVLHELTGNIETAQKALGHARRSTTEDYYDHAEPVVVAETTGLLLDWLLGDDAKLLERPDTVN